MTRTMTLDLPTFARSTVGFDRMLTDLITNVTITQNNYPPYNVVEINDDEWMISVAVAGFGMDNLDITVKKNMLTVEGTAPIGGEDVKYLHKGIGGRTFRRQFTLAEHVEVENAVLELGMLNIHLVRNVPEALQPKHIDIKVIN